MYDRVGIVKVEGATGPESTACVSALGSEVPRRSAGLCEYCRISEAAFRQPFHIEHIIAKQHGGLTQLDNLALAFQACNFKKGPNLSGIDPETGLLVALFNPRRERWVDHFTFIVEQFPTIGIEIRGRTAVGRTMVRVLGMNGEIRRRMRYELWREGMHFELVGS